MMTNETKQVKRREMEDKRREREKIERSLEIKRWKNEKSELRGKKYDIGDERC